MNEPNKSAETGNPNRQSDGTFGPRNNANPKGRPKRKTLTELIHAKLDDTPDGWEKLADMVVTKILKEKDKDILKTLWAYTDGLPKQSTDITSGGEKINSLYDLISKHGISSEEISK